MGGQPQRASSAPPGLAGDVAGAIEEAIAARLRAEGREPLPAGAAVARDRRRRLLAVAEEAVGKHGGGGRP